jgi:hypothetical protein
MNTEHDGDLDNDDGCTCPDCGVEPGDLHLLGCDVERCPECGGQLISCGCFAESFDEDAIPNRMEWDGEWPGLADCREYGLWCKRNPHGPGWTPCSQDDPEASEDLNRLMTECQWNKEKRKWLRKETEANAES